MLAMKFLIGYQITCAALFFSFNYTFMVRGVLVGAVVLPLISFPDAAELVFAHQGGDQKEGESSMEDMVETHSRTVDRTSESLLVIGFYFDFPFFFATVLVHSG